jgi:hypothetical protein
MAQDENKIPTLGDLMRPIDCYVTTITTEDGRTTDVQHFCGNPNCPGL